MPNIKYITLSCVGRLFYLLAMLIHAIELVMVFMISAHYNDIAFWRMLVIIMAFGCVSVMIGDKIKKYIR